MRINLDNVAQVYSGKQGRCCCGCAGKHTYAKQYQAWSSKHRGYDVGDDECSDRTVKMIVRKIEQAAMFNRIEFVRDDFVSAHDEDNKRVWIAYFKNPDPSFVAKFGYRDIEERKRRAAAEKKYEDEQADAAWQAAAQRFT